jgi:hypothetical protein
MQMLEDNTPKGITTTTIDPSLNRILEQANEQAKVFVNGSKTTKLGALQADGTIIICDIIETMRGGFKRIKLPDGRIKLISDADGYILVQAD